MSLVTLAEVRALVSTPLSDANLQAVIDREEAWLARQAGALTGSRVQTFWIGGVDLDDPVTLRRSTGAVTVTDNGVAISGGLIRLLGEGTIVEKSSGSWNGPSIAITYTPNDADEVKRVVIEIVRGTVIETGYDSETIGDYSYSSTSRGGATARLSRLALVRGLLPYRGPGSVRLRTGLSSERIGATV